MKSLFILSVILLNNVYAGIFHENDQLWRVYYSADNKTGIKKLVGQYDLDIWSAKAEWIDVKVPFEISSSIKIQLNDLGLSYKVMIENIQKTIHNQEVIRQSHNKEIRQFSKINLEIYHTWDEINEYINEIVEEFPYITIDTIGQTVQGRDMRVVKISTTPNNNNAIWIQCGIHAREWIAPATCLYGLDQFTTKYGEDAEITSFLDEQDVYMLVVANPDGYSYSWTEVDNRLWRKSRQVFENNPCIGVDLNRNYDDGISWDGSNTNHCSNTYPGESGFSEPETIAIRDKVYNIQEKQNLYFFLDIHNYGNLWLFAYGYKADQPPDFYYMNQTAASAAQAVFKINGTVIEYGSSYVVLYEATGTSKDWGYARGITYSYTLELQDDGQNGFLLPENQILSSAIEAWAGIFAAVNYILH